MSNPFQEVKFAHGEFKRHIAKQIKGIAIDQVLELEYGDEKVNKVRMTLHKLAKEKGIVLSTKTDDDGVLWVKRFK